MAPTDTDRDRNDRGRFADGIDPETVLDVFDAREDRAEPITASDVVEELGIARRTAHNKLNRLVDRGTLATRKVGARGRVWWTPIPREDDTESGRTRPESAPATSPDPSPGSTPEPTTTPHADGEESDAPDPIGVALDGWLPDTEANPRTARAQTRRAAEYLRDVGEYREKRDLEALADDSTLATATWWRRAVRPGLNHLADRGLVEYTRNRGYRWIGHVDDVQGDIEDAVQSD